MLVFEQEGLIEVDPNAISQLSRSTATINLEDGSRDVFEVHCTMCDFLDQSKSCCRVAFYARNLKRALVFTVNGPDSRSSWNHGLEILTRLGFKLEEVNLKLSQVLLDVVLRDIPGFATPAEARKIHDERARTLAEYQRVYENASESAAGRKAALKLNAEKRNQERLMELRKILERLLQPAVSAVADIEALAVQVKTLEMKLTSAEAGVKAERRKRELSESITSAAEKRIQELEQILVDVETSTAEVIKQKRKLAKLQGQIKKLSESLDSTERAVEEGLKKQRQLEVEAKAAQEQIALLAGDLEETGRLLDNEKALLLDERAEKARLEEQLAEAEQQITSLERECEQSQDKAVRFDETVKRAEDVQNQLAETRQALQEAVDHNKQMQQDLEISLAQRDVLSKDLHEAEMAARDNLQEAGQLNALQAQNEQLSKDLEELRADYDQQCRIRQDLDKRAAQDDSRLRELQEALARQAKDARESESSEKTLREALMGVETLQDALGQTKDRLSQEVSLREAQESELRQAHELIDKLEKTVREAKRTEELSAGIDPPKSAGQIPRDISDKLNSLEDQLAIERAARKDIALALASAEEQLSEQQALMSRMQSEKEEPPGKRPAPVETVKAPRTKPAKPLPHELRPAPKKGALFCPDWDLQGLPCRSSGQVDRAWESAFNVKLPLEGYPSQYCMAFLVILKLEKHKKLFMLFRLRENKHTLVCVPVKVPENEAALQNAVAEGLKFLKLSGFEMEEMAVENVDSTLGRYFAEA